MENKVGKRLIEYNSIFKENDELYHEVAKALGLSDCSFWILYSLREENRALTQSEICYALYQPKQTVNSALKKLERSGYIVLEEMKDRRSKQVHLTKKGRELAEQTVDQVIALEQEALSEMTETEQGMFIRLFYKYTQLLKRSMKNIQEANEAANEKANEKNNKKNYEKEK